MAYDEELADRIRSLLGAADDYDERKMFGGIAFMLAGNMCCGVVGGDLMLRLGEQGATAALSQSGVREMDFTGRPLRSMVYVAAEAIRDDDALREWVGAAEAFCRSLSPK